MMRHHSCHISNPWGLDCDAAALWYMGIKRCSWQVLLGAGEDPNKGWREVRWGEWGEADYRGSQYQRSLLVGLATEDDVYRDQLSPEGAANHRCQQQTRVWAVWRAGGRMGGRMMAAVTMMAVTMMAVSRFELS